MDSPVNEWNSYLKFRVALLDARAFVINRGSGKTGDINVKAEFSSQKKTDNCDVKGYTTIWKIACVADGQPGAKHLKNGRGEGGERPDTSISHLVA